MIWDWVFLLICHDLKLKYLISSLVNLHGVLFKEFWAQQLGSWTLSLSLLRNKKVSARQLVCQVVFGSFPLASSSSCCAWATTKVGRFFVDQIPGFFSSKISPVGMAYVTNSLSSILSLIHLHHFLLHQLHGGSQHLASTFFPEQLFLSVLQHYSASTPGRATLTSKGSPLEWSSDWYRILIQGFGYWCSMGVSVSHFFKNSPKQNGGCLIFEWIWVADSMIFYGGPKQTLPCSSILFVLKYTPKSDLTHPPPSVKVRDNAAPMASCKSPWTSSTAMIRSWRLVQFDKQCPSGESRLIVAQIEIANNLQNFLSKFHII